MQSFLFGVVTLGLVFSASAELTTQLPNITAQDQTSRERPLDTYAWNRCINRLRDPYIESDETTAVPIYLTDSLNNQDIEEANTVFIVDGKVYYLSRSTLFLETPPLRNASEGKGRIFTNNQQFFEFIAPSNLVEDGKTTEFVRRYEYYMHENRKGSFYFSSPVVEGDSAVYKIGSGSQSLPTETANTVLAAQTHEYLDRLTLENSMQYTSGLSETDKTEYLRFIKETLCRCREVPSNAIRTLVEERGRAFQMNLNECNLFSQSEPWWSVLISKAQARASNRRERTFAASSQIRALYKTPAGFAACGRKAAWLIDFSAKYAKSIPQCTHEQISKRSLTAQSGRMIASVKRGKVLFKNKLN